VTVHPDYKNAIDAAVKARGGEDASAHWRQRMKANRR
jgi:hypothetical protein